MILKEKLLEKTLEDQISQKPNFVRVLTICINYWGGGACTTHIYNVPEFQPNSNWANQTDGQNCAR